MIQIFRNSDWAVDFRPRWALCGENTAWRLALSLCPFGRFRPFCPFSSSLGEAVPHSDCGEARLGLPEQPRNSQVNACNAQAQGVNPQAKHDDPQVKHDDSQAKHDDFRAKAANPGS